MAETQTKLHVRIFSLVIAILFLLFASATSVFVIIEIVNAHHQNLNAESTPSSQQTKPPQDQSQKTQKLANYQPVKQVKTLHKKVLKKSGNSQKITSKKQTITVNYTGAVAKTGNVFDSSKGAAPLTEPLNALIPGWKKGLIGMPVGATWRLYIPANLAYGSNPPKGSGIPKNAPLVFDITLKSVK
jgi:FKBP-type peptidyl-prolyl cis-trans isomerase